MFGRSEYFYLCNLEKQKDIDELLAIIGVFKLDHVGLQAFISVDSDSKVSNFIQSENMKAEIIKTGKKLFSKIKYQEIKIEFFGIELEKIIRFIVQEGIALHIRSIEDGLIEMTLNDNDHNYIFYKTKFFDKKQIDVEIKKIRSKFKNAQL